MNSSSVFTICPACSGRSGGVEHAPKRREFFLLIVHRTEQSVLFMHCALAVGDTRATVMVEPNQRRNNFLHRKKNTLCTFPMRWPYRKKTTERNNDLRQRGGVVAHRSPPVKDNTVENISTRAQGEETKKNINEAKYKNKSQRSQKWRLRHISINVSLSWGVPDKILSGTGLRG